MSIAKARSVKVANDVKRRKESIQKIEKADQHIQSKKLSVTEACRKAGISVDKYYRIKRKFKS